MNTRHGLVRHALAALLSGSLAAATAAGAAAEPGKRPAAGRQESQRDLAAEVRQKLAARLPDNVADIRVELRGAEVILTGEVDLLAKRQIASNAAEAVPGITAVVNRLAVRREERPDTVVAVETKSALESERVTATQNIDVSADDGVVTLRGVVETVAQKRLAAWLAANQRGVRDVRNELRVAPASRPDAELQRELQASFARDPVFGDNAIDVAVSQGAVVLTGAVDTIWERQRAEGAAWIPGVVHVDVSRLNPAESIPTGRPSSRNPAEILRDLRSAVANNAALANNDLKPEVKDGTLVLTGEVDSFLEKTVAEDLARHIPGVSKVANQLTIAGADFAERAQHYHAPTGWNSTPVTITPGQSVQEADAKLKARIESALASDPRLLGEKFEVSVQHGVVTLGGPVTTTLQQTAAVGIAREAGAKAVNAEFTAAVPR